MKNVAQQGPVLFREEASGVERAFVHSFKSQMKAVTHPVRPQKELGHWFSLELELEEASPVSSL